MTSTSQEILETSAGLPKRTSKNNPLAILFFIMGVPHIYALVQRGNNQSQLVKGYSNRPSVSAQLSNRDPILAANASRSSLSHYLTVGLVAILAAGIKEIFIF